MSSKKLGTIKQKAYVLSLSDKTRNSNLKKDLESVISVEIVKGFNGNKHPELIGKINLTISKKLQNRSLNLNEIACAQGHRNMVIKALQDDTDIAYFLEDDAELPANFSTVVFSKALNVAKPTLCLISYDDESVLSYRINHGLQQGFARCMSLPTCAQFYAINKQGIELLAGQWRTRECSEVADFPTWYWDYVKFMLSPLDQKAIVAREHSTIDASRLKIQSSTFINRLSRYSFLTWLLYFRNSLSINAYTAFVHGRLVQIIVRRINHISK